MPVFSTSQRRAGGYTISGGTTVGAPRGSIARALGGSAGYRIVGGQRVAGRPVSPAAGSYLQRTPGLSTALGPKAHASTPVATVLGSVLNAASVPAYGVGQIILHPTDRRTWTASGLDLFRDPKRHVMPGQALRQRGALNVVPDRFGLRGITAFAGDVVLDPTTWVSFGAGPAAHVAEGAGRVAAKDIGKAGAEHLAAARLANGTVTLADKATAAAMTAAERKAAQRTLKMSVRVPFSRGREVLLGESARAHDAVSAIERRIGSSDLFKLAEKGFATGRGLDPLVREVHRAITAGARLEISKISEAAAQLERDIHSAEKRLGLPRGEGLHAITRHLGNAEGKHPLPAGLEEYAARARDLLDEFNAAEKAAGVVYKERPHYVSLLGATPADRKRIASLYASPSAAHLDEPFFVKPSVARSVDAFERIGAAQGFRPELNIARIIERRGRASVNTRMKKALDEAVVNAEGVKPMPRALPSTATAEARVAARRQALDALTAGAAPAVAATGDQAAAYEAATRALRQAQIANDPVAANEARRVLQSLTPATSGATPRAVAQAQERLAAAERQLAKRQQKAARIEQGNAALMDRPGRFPQSKEEWKALRRQWTEIENATKYHGGTRLPPEVADSLRRVHERIAPTVASETALREMAEKVGNIVARWKALALLSPGYQVRNGYDDGMRAYWAGARNPASFTQASRILKARRGKGATESSYRIAGRRYTRRELVSLAEDHGVIDTGYARIETHSSADATGRSVASLPGRGRLVAASQRVGQYRENVIRLGTWLELLKRGENPAEAARIVREFIFDYSDVGAAVERARRFWAPFITYPSKAVPFVAREFARRPGRAANLNAAMGALNGAAGSPDLSLLPAGAQSSFAVPFVDQLRAPIGAPAGQPLLVNPERLFSFGTLNLVDPRPSRLRQNYLGGLLNPGARAALEILTHRSMYLGSDLPKLAKAPSFINQLANRGAPIPTYVPADAAGAKRDFYTGQNVGGYSAYLDELARLLPVYGQAASLAPGGTDSAQLGAARFLFGVPVAPFDRARALARVQRFGNP